VLNFNLKVHHKSFVGQALPEPAGELTVIPDPIAGFKWASSRQGGRRERREE